MVAVSTQSCYCCCCCYFVVVVVVAVMLLSFLLLFSSRFNLPVARMRKKLLVYTGKFAKQVLEGCVKLTGVQLR